VKPSQPAGGVFVPDDRDPAAALARTTRVGIGSHPVDLELMTWHGIVSCFGRDDEWFTGVVVTDGAGSPRTGRFAGCSAAEMIAIRAREQRKAAVVGDYAALVSLAHASDAVRAADAPDVVADLARVLRATRPRVVYTHSLFDAHDTHVAVAIHVIRALRTLARDERPEAVYGCEVWRGLDWLPDEHRVALDVSGNEHIAAALMGVFDSQIGGGKRYDRAAAGRKRANATFGEARAVDRATAVELAMDLGPLVADDALDVEAYAMGIVDRFSTSVAAALRRFVR
jgi:LmbE family N-acetylglucosaminyl deacetylase